MTAAAHFMVDRYVELRHVAGYLAALAVDAAPPRRRARGSTARPRTPPSPRGASRGRRERREARRAVAIAPAAPTSPPSANERSLARRDRCARPCDHRTHALVSLGDLILDVIVALDGPLVPGDDRPARRPASAPAARPRTSPPGRATLGAEARFVGKRGADAAGELAARELARPRRRARRARRGPERRRRLDRRRRRALDGLGPRLARRARAATSSTRRGSIATCSTSPATRCSRAGGRRRAARASSSRASTARVGLGRPLDLDAGRRARSASALRALRARRRVRDRSASSEAFGELETAWVVKRGARGR